MTYPTGLSHDDNHVYTLNYPGESVRQLPSITTALKALDKPAIPVWARQMTAAAAVENIDMLATMVREGGRDATVEYLVKIADHKRDTKAGTGTDVHKLVELFYTNGRQAPETVDAVAAPYWAAFLDFDRRWQPAVLAVEYMVASPRVGYAGTGDLVVAMQCPVDGRVCKFRLDTKTMGVYPPGHRKAGQRKGPYRETAMQLAAAHYAEFAGRPNDPLKYVVPSADHCGVLALAEDGSHAVVPYTVTPATFVAFRAALSAWNWMQSEGKSVIGQPLEPVVEVRKAA